MAADMVRGGTVRVPEGWQGGTIYCSYCGPLCAVPCPDGKHRGWLGRTGPGITRCHAWESVRELPTAIATPLLPPTRSPWVPSSLSSQRPGTCATVHPVPSAPEMAYEERKHDDWWDDSATGPAEDKRSSGLLPCPPSLSSSPAFPAGTAASTPLPPPFAPRSIFQYMQTPRTERENKGAVENTSGSSSHGRPESVIPAPKVEQIAWYHGLPNNPD